MITFNIDLGQIIIAGLIATVGFFVKLELSNFTRRLDKHETSIIALVRDVSTILGYCKARNCALFVERRPEEISSEETRTE